MYRRRGFINWDDISYYGFISFIVILVVLLVLGCVLPLTERIFYTYQVTGYGTVVDRQFIAAHSETYNGTCTGPKNVTYTCPRTRYISDKWLVVVNRDGAITTIETTSAIYYALEIGKRVKLVDTIGRFTHWHYDTQIELIER